jgi:hypothetical protein
VLIWGLESLLRMFARAARVVLSHYGLGYGLALLLEAVRLPHELGLGRGKWRRVVQM